MIMCATVHQGRRRQDDRSNGNGSDQSPRVELHASPPLFGVEGVKPPPDLFRHLRQHVRQLQRSEVRRVQDGETYEGDARELEPPALVIACLGRRRLQRVKELLRAFAGDDRQQRVLVREVVVGRGGRNAGAPGDVAQGKTCRADLRQCVQRRRDQRLPEIPMVVRLLLAARGGSRWPGWRHRSHPLGKRQNVKALVIESKHCLISVLERREPCRERGSDSTDGIRHHR